MALGAGAEILMHCAGVRASAETYMGLVEVGVGLLPGGGGTKEMLLRATEDFNDNKKVDLAPFVMKAFDTITRSKVSSSAPDAINLGYLKKNHRMAMNIDWQLFQAKKDVLEMADIIAGNSKSKLYRVGGEGLYALLKYNLYQLKCGGFITEYDEHICSKIALVLCGGKILNNSLVSEEYLLELEKEAFVSLCGEVKTQERMEYMLKKGKPLRN
jgi:3-hydroxyacyl-CoA dehydrogenase